MRYTKKNYKNTKNNNFFYVIAGVYAVLISVMLVSFLCSEKSEAKVVPDLAEGSALVYEPIRDYDKAAEKTDSAVAAADNDEEDTDEAEVFATISNDSITSEEYLSANAANDYTTLSLVETSENMEPDYSISVYESEEVLYTNTRVNVRSGPGTDYDLVKTLSAGSTVTVTGETADGWYQALIDGSLAYIKADYLQENNIVKSYIFAGDSRTVQMSLAVKKSEHKWFAQVGEGYDYFVNTAIPSIDASVTTGSVIIINYGVNALHNVDKYISKVNSKIDSWIASGATVYYAAVLPVRDYPTITNDDIEAFNSKLRSGLDSRVGWLDGYTYLQTNGFSTADGLHFEYDTYRSLYSYYMSKINS